MCAKYGKQREEETFKAALGALSEAGNSRHSAEESLGLEEWAAPNYTGRD